MIKFLSYFLTFLTTACATHPMIIAPNLRELSSDGPLAPAQVAYFISPANYSRLVVQKAGGGDSLSFNPYRELEPSLQKVLFERFQEIRRIDRLPTPQAMSDAKLNYTFIPEFSTQSFTDSSWLWPPKRFTLRCAIRAVDAQGKIVWSSKYQAVGTAKDEDWKLGSGIAAERAAAIVFKKMQKDLRASAIFDVLH